jgi:hypothetical protein
VSDHNVAPRQSDPQTESCLAILQTQTAASGSCVEDPSAAVDMCRP